MERRLLKDFQIGLVEGLIQDAMASNEKGPKDVFSKIAKAIGRRTSQGSKKKDWNAVVRQKSVARDPIGSTAEGAERRHRQSVRRYILDHQKDSLMSMDAERLVEYNPLLAEIAPAARVAYAKFKIPKIKQEYEENTTGQDDVFDNAPTVDIVDETKKRSIARPRPKSARHSPVVGALLYPSTGTDKQPSDTGSTKPADASQQQEKTIQQTNVTELKDSASVSIAGDTIKVPPGVLKKGPVQTKPEPGTSQSAKDAEGQSQPSTSGSGGKSPKEAESEHGGSKKKETGGAKDADRDADKTTDMDTSKDTDKSRDTDKSNDVDKSKDTGKSKDTDKSEEKDKDDKHLKPESPKRSASPKKPGGKSKVTGEILTGWL